MTKPDLAEEYFRAGYNCAQAVLLAFHAEAGLGEEQAKLLASSFGGGMGGMREVCGTVSAMTMVVGLLDGYTDPAAKAEKRALYESVQALAAKFREKNGTVICRELLKNLAAAKQSTPEERTPAYYAVRPCVRFVRDAAEILADYLTERAGA